MLIPILLALALSAKAPPKKVVMGIDDFCPYTCLESDRPGFLVEAVRAILQRSGIELEIMPGSWTRLQMLAGEGKLDLLGPVTLYWINKEKLASTEVLGGSMSGGFMIRSGTPWRFQGIDSLKGQRVAGIKDYSYPPEMQKAFQSMLAAGHYVELVGADANRRQVQMLASKRVDTIPVLFDTFWYQVFLLKMPIAGFRTAGEITLPADRTHYRVGVLLRDEEQRKLLIQILDKGYGELRKDGTMQKILATYGIKG